jgi:hypothetical protein
MTTHTVKCAKCDLALQGPADPQSHDVLSCPRSGEGDTLENVTREVGEYIAEKAAAALDATMTQATRGSDFIKITSRYRPPKSHRFVVDFEP